MGIGTQRASPIANHRLQVWNEILERRRLQANPLGLVVPTPHLNRVAGKGKRGESLRLFHRHRSALQPQAELRSLRKRVEIGGLDPAEVTLGGDMQSYRFAHLGSKMLR